MSELGPPCAAEHNCQSSRVERLRWRSTDAHFAPCFVVNEAWWEKIAKLLALLGLLIHEVTDLCEDDSTTGC